MSSSLLVHALCGFPCNPSFLLPCRGIHLTVLMPLLLCSPVLLYCYKYLWKKSYFSMIISQLTSLMSLLITYILITFQKAPVSVALIFHCLLLLLSSVLSTPAYSSLCPRRNQVKETSVTAAKPETGMAAEVQEGSCWNVPFWWEKALPKVAGAMHAPALQGQCL